MSISNVGLDQGGGSSGWRSTIRQAHQDFDQLVQALQNGNLNAAQQAYGDFQQIQSGLTSSTATQTSSTTATNPVLSDWSALGSALQSGSLTSAQDALGKLQQDAAAAWQTHLQQEAKNAQSVYALMQSAQGGTAASGATSSATSVQNDLNSLNQALQSGDTSTAQKVLAQLEQDLRTSGQDSRPHRHHHHHGGFADANGASVYSTTALDATASSSTATTGSASSGGTAA